MNEERDDIIVLVDEDGQEVEFEHLDTIEMDENEYVVLMPCSEEDSEEQDIDEVIILKVEHMDDGEDTFVSIDNDDELDAVFEEFKQRVEEEFEFPEE